MLPSIRKLPQQAVSKELNHLNDFCLNLDETIPSSFLLIYHHNKIIENIEWEREKEREKKDINKSIPPSLNIKSKERSTRIFKNKFLTCHCNLSDRGDICMWFSAVTCTLDLCMSSLSDMLVFLCVIIPALLFFFYCRNWFSAEINEKLYQTLKPIKRRIEKNQDKRETQCSW